LIDFPAQSIGDLWMKIAPKANSMAFSILRLLISVLHYFRISFLNLQIVLQPMLVG